MPTWPRRTTGLLLTACTLWLCAGGCENGGGPLAAGPELRYQSKAMPGTTQDQVYRAALETMKQQFKISQTSPTDSIEAQPQYVRTDSKSRTGRLHLISTPSDLRRVAAARVRSEGGIVRVEVRIIVHARDTRQRQAYRAMTARADVPTETPIDQGAFVSPDRREVWTAVRRDLQAEHELIVAIESRLGIGSAAPPSTQPAGD